MRYFEVYKDMHTGTTNHNVYLKKVGNYIDKVRDMVTPDLLGVLNGYRLTLGDFSMKFLDWDTNEFKQEDFNNYVDGFCIRIETILMLNQEKQQDKEIEEKGADVD